MTDEAKRVRIGLFQTHEVLELKAPGARGPSVAEMLLNQCRHSGEMGPEPAYQIRINGACIDVFEVKGEPLAIDICYAGDEDKAND